MQKVDEQKRIRILEAAGRLFGLRPLHEVRLEDIAAEANIGKGTIYVYFKSKTDLCVCLFIEGMDRTTAEIHNQIQQAGLSFIERIDRVVRTLLSFSRQYTNLPNMIRELSLTPEDLRPITARRQELLAAVEGVLRDGISRGEVDDPHPELTARLLLAFVRELTFHPNPQVDQDVSVRHLRHILTNGVSARGNK